MTDAHLSAHLRSRYWRYASYVLVAPKLGVNRLVANSVLRTVLLIMVSWVRSVVVNYITIAIVRYS